MMTVSFSFHQIFIDIYLYFGLIFTSLTEIHTVINYSKIRKYVHISMNNKPHTRAGEVSQPRQCPGNYGFYYTINLHLSYLGGL